MNDLYTSSVSIAGKSSATRTGARIGGDYVRLNTAIVNRPQRVRWIPPKQNYSTTGISGTIISDFTSAKVDAGPVPVMDKRQSMLDEIDREIAAMTDDQLVAEILAMAGAWADNPDLTDDGFIGSRWFRTQEEWDAIIHGGENDNGDKTRITPE